MHFPRFKQIRLEQGHTRQEVCDATGIDMETLRLLEDGPDGSMPDLPIFRSKPPQS